MSPQQLSAVVHSGLHFEDDGRTILSDALGSTDTWNALPPPLDVAPQRVF